MRRSITGFAVLFTLCACSAPAPAPPAATVVPTTTTSAAAPTRSPAADSRLVAGMAMAMAKVNASANVTVDVQTDSGGKHATSMYQAVLANGSFTDMAVRFSSSDGEMELRTIGPTSFFKYPEQTLIQQGLDKPWVTLSNDARPEKLAGLRALVGKTKEYDPDATLNQIAHGGKVTLAEQTTLYGQSVLHYKIDLDTSLFPGQFITAAPVELGMGGPHVAMELWLAMGMLPVQVTARTDSQFSMTVRYSAWGSTPSVVTPPADQVSQKR